MSKKHSKPMPAVQTPPFDLTAALDGLGCPGPLYHALRAFQARYGLPRTGEPDEATVAAVKKAAF